MAIKNTAKGNPIVINDSTDMPLVDFKVYGQSIQNGVPSFDVPIPIINKEVSEIRISGNDSQEQHITLSKPITLRGIPTSSTGNVTIDGKQYISDVMNETVKRYLKLLTIDEVDLLNVTYGSHTNGNYYMSIGKLGAKTDGAIMSNVYKGSEWTNQSGFVYAPNNDDIVIVDSRFTSKDVAIQILKNENTYFIYELATPTFEPLPQTDQEAIKNLVSYYPTTNIYVDAYSKVEYIADTKTYIDNKITGISTALMKGV